MFSVAGWSVTAPLQTQTANASNNGNGKAAPNSNATPQAGNNGAADAGKSSSGGSKSRKRKRGTGNADKVTGDTVSALWETHIEGKAVGKPAAERTRTMVKVGGGERPPKSTKSDNRVYSRRKRESEGGGVGAVAGGEKVEEKAVPVEKEEIVEVGKEKEEDAPVAKKRDRKKKNKGNKAVDVEGAASAPLSTTKPEKKTAKAITQQQQQPAGPKLTPLQASMRAKLSSARFRHLNEQLYTSPSTASLDLFTATPALFDEYHAGFRQQVAVWPENPVDGYVTEVQVRGKVRRPPRADKTQRSNGGGEQEEEAGNFAPAQKPGSWATHMAFPLPRTNGTCTIADLGCGDASLSASLAPHTKKLNVRVLSFDLHAASPLVTRADIANLPLPDGSVDVAVFCLALMGTNWPDFVDEAWRVLRWRGELWIAEIKSRFERPVDKRNPQSSGSAGGVHKTHTSFIGRKRAPQQPDPSTTTNDADDDDDDDAAAITSSIDPHAPAASAAASLAAVRPFAAALAARGFVLAGAGERESVDARNKMFVRLRFVKGARAERGKNVGAEIDKSAVGGEKQKRGKWGSREREAGGMTGANDVAVGERGAAAAAANGRKKRFIERGDDGEELVRERALLKPCVYKPR